MGVVNGTIEWLFAFPDRLSVTISGADRLLDVAREELAGQIWAEVADSDTDCKAAAAMADHQGKAGDLRRDAGRKTRAVPARGPPMPISSLAGDWTATGLPATIEGAIRSGTARRRHSSVILVRRIR